MPDQEKWSTRHDVDTLFGICSRVTVLVNKGIIVDTLNDTSKQLLQSIHGLLQIAAPIQG